MVDGTVRAASYRDVFANREFRSLWLAELISSGGDQVARVALSVLVFERTHSAALAAFTFAMTFLPALFGPLLAGLADRHPRREVMVVADLLRCALVAVMVIPDVPLHAMWALLFVVQLFASPPNAARGALLADVLSGDQLTVGQGLRSMVGQIAQVGGFAVGGLLVAALTSNGSLAVDSASFAVSAGIIRFGVRQRSAPNAGAAPMSLWTSTRRGAVLIWADPQLRTLVALIWMIGLPVAAEGLAVPYAARLTPDPTAAGWLLMSVPVGAVIGAFVLTKLDPAIRLRLMGPLAAASGLPMVAFLTSPGLPIACLLFACSGMAAAYMVVAPPTFIQRTPQASRGQAIGLMSSGSIAAQGLCLALAGVAAESISIGGALALFGGLAVVLGVALTLAWHRVSRLRTPS